MKKSFYYHLGLEQFKNSFPVIIKTDRSCYLEISELVSDFDENKHRNGYIGIIDYVCVGLWELGIKAEQIKLSSVGY